MVKGALRNPHGELVLVLVLSVIVLSVTTIPRMATDILPMFKKAAIMVVTFYPGMPPEVMEKDIASRIQRWTGQSVGIEHQEAKSMLGVCIVKDFFHEEVDPSSAGATIYNETQLYDIAYSSCATACRASQASSPPRCTAASCAAS